VRWLSDAVVQHLRQVADWPDCTGTRYRLVDKIAQGGMGSVYLAQDQELDRPVALKVLADGRAEADLQGRIAREARILAHLEHPGIVPIHDFGVLPDGRLYYAMKLVRGRRLDEQVNLQRPLPELLRDFEKICEAVAFAHSHGVVHRDLKPQNIMVGAFGEILVMDWGVAKLLEDTAAPLSPASSPASAVAADKTSEATLDGTVLGTPGYMAPEQARGEVGCVDERTDVYALGAILYFLLTGQSPAPVLPRGSKESFALLPPRRLRGSIPRALEAICLKALAWEQPARYPGVPALMDDVSCFLARRRVKAYPEGVFGAAQRLASKYRTAIALILAYLAVRILLLFWSRT
jgi:serine/threonine protein kinase